VRSIDYIVVHTAGAYDWKKKRVVHQPVNVIRDYHITHNGWRAIGYHRYIEEDGTVMLGRRDDEVGSHAGGFNQHTLGVCVSGHGDFEDFNEKQMAALVRQCATWCRTYHLSADKVIGHRETADHGGPPVTKTCPGYLVDMNEVRSLVATRLKNLG
jgi:N-acetylmuramoyl-L-alanine amidase